jgi:hypothetical protein
MPTYNGAAYLAAALESIRLQNDPGLEILAVDDGSTDETLTILESFARELPLAVIRLEHSGNWVANSNLGMYRARGEWVCFLHQDDFWLSHRLERIRAGMAANPNSVVFLHPSWFIDAHGKKLGPWRCPLPSGKPLMPAFTLEHLLVQNFIAIPSPVFRRDVALQLGGLDESLWYTADWDFWLKLAAAGRATYLPEALAGFRIHPVSQTVLQSGRLADFRQQLQVVFQRHFASWSSGRCDSEPVRRAALFAIELNIMLAAAVHGERLSWLQMIRGFLQLGPLGWQRFLRDSRIAERVRARLRAGLASKTVPPLSAQVALAGEARR